MKLKKVTKRTMAFMCALFLLFGVYSTANATNEKVQLQIVQKASETKKILENQGTIVEEITSMDKEKGSATIQVKIDNSVKDEGEKEKFENTELLIIVPESISAGENLERYNTYIKSLATKVFEKNSNTKIGIVGMKGTVYDGEVGEDGNIVWGPKDEGKVNGTESNAEIVANFTNDVTTLQNGLMNMNSAKTKYNYNLQAAIRLARNTYSKNTNKILVSLYDNVPTIAIGVCKTVSYGGWNSPYDTMEEGVIAKHKELVSKTKSEILTLKDNNIDFIMLRPEDTSFDQKWYDSTTGEFKLDFDGSPYVQELYGTIANPTYGKMYSLNDANLEKVVTEYIYNDIIENVGVDFQDVTVKDYFPKEIIDNFTITISNENQADVDISHLESDSYIEWKVGELKSNQNASLTYTLQIKDMNNSELLEKVIDTNEKIEVTYKAGAEEMLTVNLTSSPKIKLSKQVSIQDDKTEDDKGDKDNTTAIGKIPQTGVNPTIILEIIIMCIICGILYGKAQKYKDIK